MNRIHQKKLRPMTHKKTTKKLPPKRRGRPQPENVQRRDIPHTMKLPDGSTLFVEVPGRFVEKDRSGAVAFTPAGVRFLDRIRALALQSDIPPRPAYITAIREGLGMTQAELGQAVGVNKMTISRWERGAMKPGPAALTRFRLVVEKAKQSGVRLAG